MDEPAVKGFDLIANLLVAEKHLTAAQLERFSAELPDEFRQARGALKPGAWYPIAWSEAVDRGLIAAFGAPDGPEAAELIEHYAAVSADDNMGTVLKLVMRFLKPHSFVRVLPKFWKRYYNRGSVELVELDKTEQRAVLTISEFPYKRYMVPACIGWIKAGLARMGHEDARVSAPTYDPNRPPPEVCRIEIDWRRE